MANGYIGKISALVTASTADLSRKLQGSTRDVDRFARSVNSQIAGASASAKKSLEGIFTPLQRAQRAFSAGLSLNLIDEAQVRRLQQAVSITEQINKPLGAASRAFQGLSADVAARLLPALLRAQDAAQRVNDEIGTTGGVTASSYKVAEQAINRAAAAFERFRQAEQIIASAPRGQELQFNDPQLFAALQASAEARRGAAAPGVASRVGSGLGDAVREVTRFDDLVAQAAARVNGIRLAPQVDTTQLERAQGEYQDLIVQQRQAVERLNRLSVDPSVGARAEQERRIAAANTFLQVDQRESQLTSLAGLASTRDASGRTIQQRVAAINSLNEQAQAEASLRADQEARLAVANSLLQVDQRESQLTSISGRATALPAGFSEGVGRDRVRGRTGSLNLDSTPPPAGGFSEQAQRDIDALATRVGAVRQQLETLPNSIRTRFIPELQRAQAQLVTLQNSPAATVQAIENATQRVQRLEAAARRASQAFNFRQSFGGAGLRGIEEGLNQQALQGYTAQLQLLQQTLAGTSQTARGPAVVAFNNLRNAIADAMERGTLETEQTRRVVRQLTQEAVRATAAAAGIGERGLANRLRRVGDIGRGSFGKIGLGVQQAAFAVEDFFSVTGGLDQRIRAAGNNISQLGFILGGTTGLIAGVSVAIGAQLIAALVRFANNGRGAEDQAKAINDSLEKQRTIVDELRQAFESLAGTLAEGVFSAANSDLRTFSEEIRKLERQQAKARGDVAAQRDPRTAAIGSNISVIDRALQSETDPVRAQIRARRRRELEDSADRVRAQVANAPAPSSDQVAELLRRIGGGVVQFARAPQTRGPFEDRSLQARGREIAAAADRVPAGTGIDALRGRLAALREAQGQLGAILEAPRGPIGVSRKVNVNSATAEVQQNIALVERELSAAVDAAANSSLVVIQRAGKSIGDNVQLLEKAIESNVTGATQALDAQENLGASLRDARDRLVDALDIKDAADRSRAVDAIKGEIIQIEAAIKARQGEISAIDSVRRSVDSFAQAVDRTAGKLLESVASDAAGFADQARRGANNAAGRASVRLGLGRDVEFAERQQLAADKVAKDIETRAAKAREEVVRLRGQFEKAASAGDLGPNVSFLVREREKSQAVLNSKTSSPEQRSKAEAELQTTNQQIQLAFENSPIVRTLADLADSLDEAAQGAIAFADAVEKGRNLVLTDGQRVADDFIAQVQQLNAALKANEITDEQRSKTIARVRNDGLRQLAPTVFGLADQVANAVLQGPSRAALQAADVSTVEGSRELNRLLRGDDSAREQPLVELQREANKIAERIARGIENNEAQLAN
jgi:hypothetical protein